MAEDYLYYRHVSFTTNAIVRSFFRHDDIQVLPLPTPQFHPKFDYAHLDWVWVRFNGTPRLVTETRECGKVGYPLLCRPAVVTGSSSGIIAVVHCEA